MPRGRTGRLQGPLVRLLINRGGPPRWVWGDVGTSFLQCPPGRLPIKREGLTKNEETIMFNLTTSVQSPEQLLIRREAWEILSKLMLGSAWSRLEADIVESRILNDSPLTLAQLGTRWGLSKERIRQIEARVLGRCSDQLDLYYGRANYFGGVDSWVNVRDVFHSMVG